MPIFGCQCLNIVVHVQSVLESNPDNSFVPVQLTLDGIHSQHEFLMHFSRDAEWEIYMCKVCRVIVYKKYQQQIYVSKTLTDYSTNILDIQNKDSFSKSFNLILPSTAVPLSPTRNKLDVKAIDDIANNQEQYLKKASEERIALFMEKEYRQLSESLSEMSRDKAILKSVVASFSYEEDNDPTVESEGLANIPIKPLKHVKFSLSDDTSSKKEEKENPEAKSRNKEEEFFQFDMDDVFDANTGLDDGKVADYSSDEDRSSSSGCETDINYAFNSVPINLPLGYRQPEMRKRSSSVKSGEDIAYSMQSLIEEFHGKDEDVPKPRLSKSFNPSRMYR